MTKDDKNKPLEPSPNEEKDIFAEAAAEEEEDIFANAPDDDSDIFANAPDDDLDISTDINQTPTTQETVQNNFSDLTNSYNSQEQIAEEPKEEEDIFAEIKDDESEEKVEENITKTEEKLNLDSEIDSPKTEPLPTETLTEIPTNNLAPTTQDILEENPIQNIPAIEEETPIIQQDTAKIAKIDETQNITKDDDLDIAELENSVTKPDEAEAKTNAFSNIKLDEELENKIKDIDIENIDDLAISQPQEEEKSQEESIIAAEIKMEGEDKSAEKVEKKAGLHSKIHSNQPKIDNPQEWLEKLMTAIKNPHG